MTSAHVLSIEAPRPPLEVELAALKQEFSDHNRASQKMKARLYRGWERWKNERSTALNDYLRNSYPDFEERHGTGYAAIYVGCALEHGFEGRYTADLEPLGWALMAGGKTLADLHALILKLGTDEALRALRRERSKKGAESTTTRRLPESAAESLDGLATRLQSLPDMPVEDTERRGVLVRMLEAAPAPVFEALAQMVGTGENTMEGLTAALKVMPFRTWMKRQPCAVTGETHNVELHHWRLGEHTARHVDLYLPIVDRLHRAEVGHKHDSVHGSNSLEWAARHFGSPEGATVRAVQYWWAYLEYIGGA